MSAAMVDALEAQEFDPNADIDSYHNSPQGESSCSEVDVVIEGEGEGEGDRGGEQGRLRMRDAPLKTLGPKQSISV
ncbi:hypothetical protein KIPB_012554 [Kipferlia bialata]|uniref:Uncharacterized protein n=1 Tax=Kipferlia bialata TaxID=797122 RepID=A0A9K3D929_9EUKA|nr:hypothetical protein KIPB_012554 [Kipferlia bialata]|eukprot:g12554.t1